MFWYGRAPRAPDCGFKAFLSKSSILIVLPNYKEVGSGAHPSVFPKPLSSHRHDIYYYEIFITYKKTHFFHIITQTVDY